jgi:hypothetical protein
VTATKRRGLITETTHMLIDQSEGGTNVIGVREVQLNIPLRALYALALRSVEPD